MQISDARPEVPLHAAPVYRTRRGKFNQASERQRSISAFIPFTISSGSQLRGAEVKGFER